MQARVGTHAFAPSHALLCQQSTIPDVCKGKARLGVRSGAPTGHSDGGAQPPKVHRSASPDHHSDAHKLL